MEEAAVAATTTTRQRLAEALANIQDTQGTQGATTPGVPTARQTLMTAIAALDAPSLPEFVSYEYKPLARMEDMPCRMKVVPPPASILADSVWTYMRRGSPLYPGFPRQCTPANIARVDAICAVHASDPGKFKELLHDFLNELAA